MPRSRRTRPDVFLNIPYDKQFENLFLAYISGISALGFVPRATLEIRSSAGRLDKIVALIQACEYSIHDLSRVQLDRRAPRTPRFNMPFELGLSVAWEKLSKQAAHKWFVCESMERRLQKSLSDLNSIDPKIHKGNIRGVFTQLRGIFLRPGRQPSVQQMLKIYRDVRKNLPGILKAAGTLSLYDPSVFQEICVVASDSAFKNVM